MWRSEREGSEERGGWEEGRSERGGRKGVGRE